VSTFKDAWKQLQKGPKVEPENGHAGVSQRAEDTYLPVKIDPSAPYQILPIPEWVTPRQAREWRNAQDEHPRFKNRNLSERTIERYMSDMREGRWILTHQPIALAEGNIPLDGQHRAEALARLMGEIDGVWMLVARDVPYEIMPAIDDTFKRGFHHVRQIAGKSNANAGAAAIRLAATHVMAMEADAQWQLSTFSARKNFSTAQLEQWEHLFSQYCDIEQATIKAYQLYPPVLLSATGAFYLLLSMHVGERLAADFIDRVAEGANLDSGDPRLVLKDSLIDRAVRKPVPTKELFLCLLIKGFNAWAKGETNRKWIVFRKGEFVPRIEYENL
jgi:hypothetical protein